MPTSKKPKKKYVKKINSDIINPQEHINGLQGQFKHIASHALKNNNFTVNDLLNEGLLLYRWAFVYAQLMPEYSIIEICEFIEKQFLQLHEIEKTIVKENKEEEVKRIRAMKINISEETRELLLFFIDEVYKAFFLIKTRTQYAKIMKEAIVNSNLRIGLCAKHMNRFINRKDVEEELNLCRNKLARRSNYGISQK